MKMMMKIYNNRTKKTFLLVVLIVISLWSSGAVYYVSSTGNDTNSGLSSSLPWKTLAKVNAAVLKAGDQILFKRGDTFYGSLILKNSGTAGSPITFGAFGTGSNPIISGFSTVTAWTNLGSNIWESTSGVSSLSTCNMVLINGENTPMGRYPDATATNGGYLSITSVSGNGNLTSTALSGNNWTGAEVAIRTNDFKLERRTITSHISTTLNYTNTSYVPESGCGFFIQKDLRTLTVQNEWFFNPTSKKLSLYSTSLPTNVKIAATENLVTLNEKSYITFNGIDFEGANSYAIFGDAYNTPISGITIQNCKFSYIGIYAVEKVRSSNFLIDGNVVANCNTGAFNVNNCSNVTITDNDIENTGLLVGMLNGLDGAISVTYLTNATISRNTVRNAGYHGITFYGQSITLQNNYINGFCSVLDDGGGIYTYTGYLQGREPMTNIRITGNVVLNGVTYGSGTPTLARIANGIYLDQNSNNVEIDNNTVAYCRNGCLRISQPININTHHNTFFDAENYLVVIGMSTTAVNVNNIFSNNTIVAKSATQRTLYIYSPSYNYLPSSADIFDNNIYARPIDDNKTFNVTQPNQTGNLWSKTLAEWKSFSGKDVNSGKSGQKIYSEDDIQFEYNTSITEQTISLSQPMIDMKGTKYAGSITLQPFTSVVLMKDANPAKYFTEYKSICDGSSYNGWTVAGKYERTLTAKTGGDSIVTTYLTVNPKYALSENITINAGEIYNGWSTSGTYTRTLSSKFGCDSVVTTNLTVESLKTGSINTTQTIELKKGYNMISTYVAATDPVVSTVTQPIVESGDLIKIQDEAGNSYENWGSFGGWINNLGAIQTTEGYKIKVAEDCTLQITGLTVALPLDIPLNAGWNIISFPRTDALDAMTIIQPLINQNKLIKVQDEAGNSIEDWGVYGGWKNGIGNFVPGKAYRVKLSASAVLTIQESYPKSALVPVIVEKTNYFTRDTEGNGVDHMNINLVGLREAGLVAGDELAAFDGDVCVGTLKISNLQLSQGSASLVASATTGAASKDGFKDGSALKVYLWKQQSGAESQVALTALKGSLNYLKSASILVQLKSLTTRVTSLSDDVRIDVYPNPTQGRFTVRFSTLPESGSHIDVMDLSGRKVASRMVNGLNEEINLAGQAAGMYLVKSVIGTQEKIQKLVLQ